MPDREPPAAPASGRSPGTPPGLPLRVPFSVVRQLAPAEGAAVRTLVEAVSATSGHSPVDQERLQQALEGAAVDFLAALAWDHTHTLVGYTQAVRSAEAWDVELASRVTRGHLQKQMLRAVCEAVAARDDTHVRLWRYQATADDDWLAAQAGFAPSREIRQLRCSLPVPAGPGPAQPALATRPFVVGRDEEAWLELNNRAFAWHPEQGKWTAATLRDREREPWFDPEGFLLHEIEGKPAGFCWTKTHRDTPSPLGEIYVVGIDPALRGRGLGRALVLAGLDHLARAGLTVGMLYVDATNHPALRLYESLGFEVHHVDRVYEEMA